MSDSHDRRTFLATLGAAALTLAARRPVPLITRRRLKRVGETFNRAGTEARKAGLHFAYHNHDHELAAPAAGGPLPLDVLFEHTDPALVTFEMDLYWMVHGGADPLAYFKKYPGRISLVH